MEERQMDPSWGYSKMSWKLVIWFFFLKLLTCKYITIIAETCTCHHPQLSPCQQYGCSDSSSPSHFQPCIIHYFPDCITTILHNIHECNIATFKAINWKGCCRFLPSIRHNPERQMQRQSKKSSAGMPLLFARNFWAQIVPVWFRLTLTFREKQYCIFIKYYQGSSTLLSYFFIELLTN